MRGPTACKANAPPSPPRHAPDPLSPSGAVAGWSGALSDRDDPSAGAVGHTRSGRIGAQGPHRRDPERGAEREERERPAPAPRAGEGRIEPIVRRNPIDVWTVSAVPT